MLLLQTIEAFQGLLTGGLGCGQRGAVVVVAVVFCKRPCRVRLQLGGG